MGIERILKSLIYKHGPRRTKTALAMLSILDERYGHWQSLKKGEPIDRQGAPLPWYTYPAIEFVDQLDFTDKVVFEWGSGNSSLYWARVAKSVMSIEDDPLWFRKVQQNRPTNLTISLVEGEQDYVDAIARTGQKYDVIAVDGSYRYQCGLIAPKHLKDGGLIVLDNSDWCPDTAKCLRDSGLLQVDLSGFGPAAELTWTTTLFFHRGFNASGKDACQPRPSLGSLPPPKNDTNQMR